MTADEAPPQKTSIVRILQLLCAVTPFVLWGVLVGFNILREASLESTIAEAGPQPEILRIAAVIREETSDPLTQVSMVDFSTRQIVEYDNAAKVYGADKGVTLSVAESVAQAKGWLYPRGDCKTRSVVAKQLFDALGLTSEICSSGLTRHCTTLVYVGPVVYEFGRLERPAYLSTHPVRGRFLLIRDFFGRTVKTLRMSPPMWAVTHRIPAWKGFGQVAITSESNARGVVVGELMRGQEPHHFFFRNEVAHANIDPP